MRNSNGIKEKYIEAVKKYENFFDELVKNLNAQLDAYKGHTFDAKTKYSIENAINYFIDTAIFNMRRDEINPFIFKNHCNSKYENIQDGELFEIDEHNNTVIVHFEVILYRIIYISMGGK